jgi:two-component system, chemotaxis family, chemotaxis protein CheY
MGIERDERRYCLNALIAEDDFTSRMFLQKLISPYGTCHVVMDGKEAVQAFQMAWEENKPYDMICMDIMMPNMDGLEAVRMIREMETQMGVKQINKVFIIITSSLSESDDITSSMKAGANWYLLKPIDGHVLLKKLRELSLI